MAKPKKVVAADPQARVEECKQRLEALLATQKCRLKPILIMTPDGMKFDIQLEAVDG